MRKSDLSNSGPLTTPERTSTRRLATSLMGKKQPSMHPTRKVGYGRKADVTGPPDRVANDAKPTKN